MANTPNIDLVKPAGTDHALVSVLNSNSDKIDTFAGTTNQAITTLNGKTTVKSLGSNDNLNDLNGASATGYYYITTGVANAPTGGNWTQLLVIGGSITTQIVYSSARMWLRAYTGNPLSWTSWQEFALKGGSAHGTTVSLDSYTSSDYTFASDGYVVATCESSASAKAIVQIKDSNGNNFFKLGGWGNSTYASYSCYVKSGMKARVVTLENNGHITFEPFT